MKTDRAGLTITREEVLAAIKQRFPKEDPSTIMAILDIYGEASYERERERVHLAILDLSEGDSDRLVLAVEAAKHDYRDVLFWAEYGVDRT